MIKSFLICVASSLIPVSSACAEEPTTDIGEIREEVGELKLLVDELNRRLIALEESLSIIEEHESQLLPWQREQPFLWDGRQPVNMERWPENWRRQQRENRALPRYR